MNKESKRIAFVINSLSKGGAERTISNITTHLPGDYEVDIIVNDDSIASYCVAGNIVSLGLKQRNNKLSVLYQTILFFKRISALRKMKRKNRYRLVISFSESANIANVISGNKYSSTCLSVRTFLSSYSNVMIYRLFGYPAIKVLYRFADTIISVSEGVRKDLIDNFGIPDTLVKTIGNGCDLNLIERLSNEMMNSGEHDMMRAGNIIVTTGRIVKEKGQWHLIRVVDALKQKGIKCRLLIIGDGYLRRSLEELVVECHLQDEVLFTGFMDNPFKLMAKADLFVFPSVTEGMGNGLIEALACGLPCISTDHDSGAREILSPSTDVSYKNRTDIELAEYGILVPVCDDQFHKDEVLTTEEQIMADAIEMVLKDESIRSHYHEKAIERASQMALDEVVRKWIEVIEA